MKKQLFIIGITVVLIAVGLSGCIEENTLSTLKYENTEYGFALYPPEGWTVNETSGNLGTFIFFLGPTEDNCNTNVVISANKSDSTDRLNTAVEEHKPVTSSPNITMHISRETTVNGMNAYEFVYSMKHGQNNPPDITKQKVVLVEKDNLILVIVYSTSESLYDKYITVFDDSVSSLVIG